MSFINGAGADEAVVAVHAFRWLRARDNEEAEDLLSMHPWIPSARFNGIIGMGYGECLALGAEVLCGWDDAVRVLPAVERHSAALVAVEAQRVAENAQRRPDPCLQLRIATA